MPKYRHQFAQLVDTFFITDGGLETILIFDEGVELPDFAAFVLLKDESKCKWMKNYLRTYLNIAQKYNTGFILQSVTWRANPDWMRKLGYSDEDIINVNREAIEFLYDIRNEYETEKSPIIISGCIGPRGDGYNSKVIMSAKEAQAYHVIQIGIISQTNTDVITAMTMNYPEEAIGITRAAKAVDMPVVISFTVETDGRLPTGHTLKEAIELVDNATQNGPAYYMINCAHPTSFEHVLIPEEPWVARIHGVRGNASRKSHAELNECKELDSGNPVEFGEQNRALLSKLKNLNVFGGCCGTDHRHIEEICKQCIDTFNQLKHTHRD
jgi:S-methylmethionine-dependent homocysteine/selenocysteine methylase